MSSQKQQPFQGPNSPEQRAEMEMDRVIQKSNRDEMMEMSPFYQDFLMYLDSEHAKALENQDPVRLAYIENLNILRQEGKLLKVLCCVNEIDPSTDLMGMSYFGKPLLDSTYGNDYYKWTMKLVFEMITIVHGTKMIKFCVDFRTQRVMDMIVQSPELQQKIQNALSSLASRHHDRATLCSVPDPKVKAHFSDCFLQNRMANPLIRDCTVDLSQIDPHSETVISFYIGTNHTGKPVPIIELCGPQEQTTWLETSVLQVLFEVIRRQDNRSQGISEIQALFESLFQTHLSMNKTDSTAKSLGTAILMIGRRTQSPVFVLMANLYLDQFSAKFKGTSSVWAWNVLKNVLGIELKKFVPMGTHAHELSMFVGGIGYGKYGQIVSHYLYWLAHIFGTEAKFLALPDTLETRCFLKVAKQIFVKLPNGQIVPFLSLISGFRQDSGNVSKFVELVRSVIPDAIVLASEIGSDGDLDEAVHAGCSIIGTGGYMGDKRPSSQIEMACKPVQVDGNCAVAKYSDAPGKRKGNTLGCTVEEYHQRLDDAVIPTLSDSNGQPFNDYTCYLLEVNIRVGGIRFTPYYPPS
jgi:nicotinic acid phosphoribosyltransferase